MAVGVTGPPERARDWRALAPLLVAPPLLIGHWYLARPDPIATWARTDSWLPLTGAPAPAALSFLAAFVVLGIVPVVIGIALGRSPAQIGLGPGRAREGMRWLAAGIPLGVMAGWIAAQTPSLTAVYPLGGAPEPTAEAWLGYAGAYLLYYTGFEFFFRGFLLMGLEASLGSRTANLVQSALAVAIHFGKPVMETISAWPASLVFGWLTLRTRSVWYAVVIHWIVGVSLVWFASR